MHACSSLSVCLCTCLCLCVSFCVCVCRGVYLGRPVEGVGFLELEVADLRFEEFNSDHLEE